MNGCEHKHIIAIIDYGLCEMKLGFSVHEGL
jgi:hypothetical protein